MQLGYASVACSPFENARSIAPIFAISGELPASGSSRLPATNAATSFLH